MSRIRPAYRAKALAAYRQLNDSPVQRRLRREHPCLVGAVYWNPQEVPERTLRYEMKRIRDTGFTFVRFHCIDPQEDAQGRYDFTYPDLWIAAAVEAGLNVFPHFPVGRASDAALAKAGLSKEEADRLGPEDPRVARAILHRVRAIADHYRGNKAVVCWLLGGEPHGNGIPLADDLDRERFLAWLKARYASPAAVHRAWSIYPARRPRFVASWDDALRVAETIKKGDGLVLATTGAKHEVYGATRDLMRFRADRMAEHHRLLKALVRKVDPRRPVWVGNHQLFLNEAQLGWDVMEAGRTADAHYTSIHLSWHFEQSDGEVDRPVYMQSRFTSDAFKGGLTSAYETTGGPVQYSGGFGNHMDAGLMRRLMVSYLAAGNESIAFWDWVCRPGGIEAGEYGLVTLSGKVADWAREAGRVARAMERHSQEIWQAREEPELAILRSWDTEAILAIEPRRFDADDGLSGFSRGGSQQHMRALIGASRAAIDGQVAYEYLTEREVLSGLAGVYPAIYLPHVRACSVELLDTLLEYVRNGGRLIADVQLGFHDPWGKLHPRGKGTPLARLFGAWVDSVHDARTRPQTVDGIACPGFYGDVELDGARVVKRFADGRPAISEAPIGLGQAVLVAFDPARHCWKPGNAALQGLLADLYRGDAPRRWWSDAPLAFRRSHARADHWFFINDGPARSAVLRVYDRVYRRGADVLSGTAVPVDGTLAVDLPEMSAVWLRMER